jgi:hypothetical protein
MRGRVLGAVLGCVLCVVVLAGVLVGVQRRNAKGVRGLGLGGKDKDQDDAGYKSWGKRRPLKEQVGRMPLPYSDVTISKVAYGSLHFAEFAGGMEHTALQRVCCVCLLFFWGGGGRPGLPGGRCGTSCLLTCSSPD